MARKKKEEKSVKPSRENVVGLKADVLEQPIVETLEINYMPYAMSVIVSRAIPEIDGFKPAHRKLLYTMYKMNLLSGSRTKSANIVGQTMRLNPHGDAAIYETMVRLSKGYEALLTPFVDSKGNFGKVYSRDMAYAASRYTEAKLSPICAEIFGDIDKDTVDFTDNYDNTMKEPTLLPTAYPNVLVSANQGIAVGMASSICGFNLEEVCRTAIELIKNSDHDIMSTMPAPDLSTGGEIIYSRADMEEIYKTGRGSFKVRSKWRYIKDENVIEIYEIPYSTTVEAIMDKSAELIKNGSLKEIADMRDETDLSGLKLAIDLKRGTDPEKLMQKLFKQTPLMDSVSCNFNVLIAGTPRVMGVAEIFDEWTAWRCESVKRRVYFELGKKKARLHLLEGLQKILLDIDKAIKIIRETELESEVVPNLMIGFGIDEVQAEFVADIKLRNINREYILKQTKDLQSLQDDIADLEATLNDKRRIKAIIRRELEEIIKKYPSPRKTAIVYEDEIDMPDEEETVADYPVTLFLSREGYFKKITPLSLRMSAAQKYKEGDGPFMQLEAGNRDEIIFFTNRQQAYKVRCADFDDTKASVLGTYLASFLTMDEDEKPVGMVVPGDYAGNMLFFFENGKAAKVPLSTYATKTNRRKLTGAYSDKSPLRTMLFLKEDTQLAVYSTEGRALIFNSAHLAPKTTRVTLGVQLMTLKKKYTLDRVERLENTPIKNEARYRVRAIPAAGALLRPEDTEEIQLELELQ